MNEIDYYGRKVNLNYSELEKNFCSRDKVFVKGVATGDINYYAEVEEKALLNLLMNASSKKPHLTLKEIVEINENVEYPHDKRNVKMTLTGIPVYCKK